MGLQARRAMPVSFTLIKVPPHRHRLGPVHLSTYAVSLGEFTIRHSQPQEWVRNHASAG
jgi:hypothetical protein